MDEETRQKLIKAVDIVIDHKLNMVGAVIGSILNEDTELNMGFCLLTFPFGDEPDRFIHYTSNAQMPDMLKAMKEFIARAELNMKTEIMN